MGCLRFIDLNLITAVETSGRINDFNWFKILEKYICYK